MAKSEKRERFEKVAANRVQRVIDTLGLLKNCSNRNNYEYSEQDVEQMFREINNALRDAKSAYSSELNKKSNKGFSFNND